MKEINIAKGLHDVFGEKQTVVELVCTVIFAWGGTLLIYLFLYRPNVQETNWMTLLGFVLVLDVLAGCVANFTHGTNQFYSQRPKNRLVFIVVHVHLLAIAWLLSAPFQFAVLVWSYTIVSALLINHLRGYRLQVFGGALLMCCGFLGLLLLPVATWFLAVSLFFMMKVIFSFAVDHYGNPT